MRKGSRVAVDGRLEWREWESSGEKRQGVSVVADSVQFLDSPADGRADGGDLDGELVGASAGEGDLAF
jgi:single-stranded DNA-binding protein